MPRPDRREKIMQAAEKLFASKRLHEITLDDIVAEAHVGKGTVYTYFKDKDDLFFQVATHGFEEMCDLLDQRVADDAAFIEQVRQACEAISAFFRQRRQLFRMMQTEDARMSLLSGTLRSRWFDKRRRLVQSLAGILRKGQTAGAVRRDIPDEAMAELLLGMLRARGRNLPDDGGPVSVHLMVDLFLRGAATGRQADDGPGKRVCEKRI